VTSRPSKLGFDPEVMAGTNVYKILAGCIVPRPIGFLSTVGPDGVFNAAPFSFFNGISHNPPMVCASIDKIHASGNTKDTLTNILHTRDFVVNIVDEDLARAQDYCSGTFPPEVDEIAAAGLTAAPSQLVLSPRVEESPVNFECRLLHSIPLPESPYTLIIGRVVFMHVREDLMLSNGRIDPARLRAVGRMTGNSYVTTRALFTLEHDTFEVMSAAPK